MIDQMLKFYNMKGEQIEMTEWFKIVGNAKLLEVSRTEGKLFTISTMFTGIAANLPLCLCGNCETNTEPMLFQTIIIRKHNPFKSVAWIPFKKYAALSQAKGGHIDAVEKYGGWGPWRLWRAWFRSFR